MITCAQVDHRTRPVNGVARKLQAWYDAFDVRECNTLFVARSARVSIW